MPAQALVPIGRASISGTEERPVVTREYDLSTTGGTVTAAATVGLTPQVRVTGVLDTETATFLDVECEPVGGRCADPQAVRDLPANPDNEQELAVSLREGYIDAVGEPLDLYMCPDVDAPAGTFT